MTIPTQTSLYGSIATAPELNFTGKVESGFGLPAAVAACRRSRLRWCRATLTA